MRPFKLWVVIGEEIFRSVVKSSLRKSLNKKGHIKKVEFRRSLSSLQVRKRITETFPDLKLETPIFMKCKNLKMVTVNVEGGGYPNGSDLQAIASKESLYLVEPPSSAKVAISDL